MEVEEGIMASAAPMTTTAAHSANEHGVGGGGSSEAAGMVAATATLAAVAAGAGAGRPLVLMMPADSANMAAVGGGEGQSTPTVGQKRSSEEMRGGAGAGDASSGNVAVRPKRDPQNQVHQVQGLKAAHNALAVQAAAAPHEPPVRNSAEATRQVADPSNARPPLATAAIRPAATSTAPMRASVPDEAYINAAGRSAGDLAARKWAQCTSLAELRARLVVLEEALARFV